MSATDLKALAETLGNKWNPHDTKSETNPKLGTREAI
jgi:hypothetical protein